MKKTKQAFTIVELMLAVAFLGTLLLSIAMLTMQLINIYTKGATMRAINSTGSSIMRDIRTAIGSSNNEPSDLDTNEEGYLYRDNTANEYKSKNGMFCTGSYTYVWNYQAAMLGYRDHTGEASTYISIEANGASRPYALARVKDSNCNTFNSIRAETTKSIKVEKNEDLTVLLDGSTSGEGTDLALYDFSVLTATRSTLNNRALYTISFVLGTTRGGVNVTSSSNYCELNSNANAGETATSQGMADVTMDYCSVNRFEFTVRQTGSRSGIGV